MVRQKQAIGIIGMIFALAGGIAWFLQAVIPALMLWGVAIIIIFKMKRRKEPIPWKKHKGIRRHFPIQVRDQVLKAQKYKCANCGISISPPLVHYDHLDGNHSNIKISNCQALCPNCHSLNTDDDRRNQ